MRRRRYEVTEMYALIDISNQMLEDSAFDMEGEDRRADHDHEIMRAKRIR